METIEKIQIAPAVEKNYVDKLNLVLRSLNEKRYEISGLAVPIHALIEVISELSKIKTSTIDSRQNVDCISDIKDYTFIKHGKKFNSKVFYKDISHIESDKDYCRIYTTDRVYHLHSTLSAIKRKMPNDKFFQCHRSFIVNIDMIDSFNNWIVKTGDHTIRIGDVYKERFMKNMSLLNSTYKRRAK